MTRWDDVLDSIDGIAQDGLGKIRESGLEEWFKSRGAVLDPEANVLVQVIRIAQARLDAKGWDIGTTAVMLAVMDAMVPMADAFR